MAKEKVTASQGRREGMPASCNVATPKKMNTLPVGPVPIPDKLLANGTKVIILDSRHSAINVGDKGIIDSHVPGYGYGVAIKKYYPSALPAQPGTTTTRVICFLYVEVEENEWKEENK